MDTLKDQGVSERTACKSVGISRCTYQYKSQHGASDTEPFRVRVVELSRKHKRYGYRRIAAMLRRNGELVNHTDELGCQAGVGVKELAA